MKKKIREILNAMDLDGPIDSVIKSLTEWQEYYTTKGYNDICITRGCVWDGGYDEINLTGDRLETDNEYKKESSMNRFTLNV